MLTNVLKLIGKDNGPNSPVRIHSIGPSSPGRIAIGPNSL